MKTVLVKYYKSVISGHWAIDDSQILKSEIVKVDELTDLNSMFENIDDVKVLSTT